MAKENNDQNQAKETGSIPDINLPSPVMHPDYATIFGIVFAFGLIIGAIAMGQSDANFLNVPALMIVLFGTMAATSISHTPRELMSAGHVLSRSLVRPVRDISKLSKGLLDIAVVARKRGLLSLTKFDEETSKEPFLQQGLRMVVDGQKTEYLERVLRHEMDAQLERHLRSAGIMRRGSEIAPAMGLIGTLVGLVQMLADLENPETIGPAMAVALLTTFYGAILGTVVLAPLASKLEKNSADEMLSKTLMLKATLSIAAQENPRNLEMLINTELPPSERIEYFD